MPKYYNSAEVRSADERAAAIANLLPKVVASANRSSVNSARLIEVRAANIKSVADLADIPVMRKSEMVECQMFSPPLGGVTPRLDNEFSWIFQSPGPIYEPGMATKDWWRIGRFLYACGIGKGDIVLNCLSYHLTPGGAMFESGARAVGATVVPGGPGRSELLARAARATRATAYAGTPDFLKVILDSADKVGLNLRHLTKAAVSGGALFPSVRQAYADRGIKCLQVYATAELGNIAYETVADEGLIVDEGVIVEIVTPGTDDPVPYGKTGEVVVTLLNCDYPLVRYGTGDLSSFLKGTSRCGRTNVRLAGWKGRADQTTKVKGMFVRPEQVADFVRRHKSVHQARIVVTRQGEMDEMQILVETEGADTDALEESAANFLKVRGKIVAKPIGTLPDDGKVIDDQRNND